MEQELSANTTLSHYRIVSKIGAGGMGEIYLAEDSRLRRKIALKVLPEAIARDPERLRRFEQEAFAASSLNHPNILTIYEFGAEGATHFLATELIDGETLRARLQGASLALNDALDIAVQTAQALGAAHKANIIHRDIKPENVMIRADGIVKVLDFGLAKLIEPAPVDRQDAEAETRKLGLTQAGTVMGTVAYMSPEQARGQAVDACSDVFSLGVMIYEMLAHRQPFTGETINHTIVAILEQEPKRLTAIPAELEAVLTKALQKNKQNRYQSAGELLHDLKEVKQELEFKAKLQRTPSQTPRDTQTLNAATMVEGAPQSAIATAHSIVVLPFSNIGSDGDDDYFSDGLTEEIIADLSKIRSLRVISRNSAMKLKGTAKDTRTITQELNVRYLLDGSVRKAGQRLRIAAQLIDGVSDANLWAEKYQGSLDDIFEIQESVAHSIAEALKITLNADEVKQLEQTPIADAQAYDLYLKARAELQYGVPAALDRAIALLKQGLAIIGDNELLYAALGYNYYFYFRWISKLDENYLRLANDCMQKTFALNPASSHGFSLKGLLRYAEGDIAESIRALYKAVELQPTNIEALLWLSINSAYIGNGQASLEYANKLRQYDPLSPVATFIKAVSHVFNGEFTEALQCTEEAWAMDTPAPLLIWSAIVIKAWCGKTDEVMAHAEQLAQIAPNWVFTQHALFLKHALRGEKELALQYDTAEMVKEAQHDCHFALHLTHGFALIGETEKALDLLELAVRNGMVNYRFLSKGDPLLENLRHEGRFQELMQETARRSEQVRETIYAKTQESLRQVDTANPADAQTRIL